MKFVIVFNNIAYLFVLSIYKKLTDNIGFGKIMSIIWRYYMLLQLLACDGWLTALLTFLGAFLGGVCAFIGGIVGVAIQANINNKDNKRKILLEYYEKLGCLKNFINKISNTINMNNIKDKFDEFKVEMDLNGKFSYFIAKVWLKDKYDEFISEMDTVLDINYKVNGVTPSMQYLKDKIVDIICKAMRDAMEEM